MTHQHNSQHPSPSALASLRALMPNRPLTLTEARTIAELQAERLLRLCRIETSPVPSSIVSTLPHIQLAFDTELAERAASGASTWNADRGCWVITLNPKEPRARQRFTLLHEFKHIVDHHHVGLGGRLPTSLYGLPPVEYLADYFAGCVLIPKRALRAAYYSGEQRLRSLAQLFDVSVRAIEVRLDQLGITEQPQRRSATGQPRMQPTEQQPGYFRTSRLTEARRDLAEAAS